MDEAGVEQAVAAFCKNDPFYPRPKPDDPEIQELWEKFKERFPEVSEAILGHGSPEARLPAMWVELVEEMTTSEPDRDLRDFEYQDKIFCVGNKLV